MEAQNIMKHLTSIAPLVIGILLGVIWGTLNSASHTNPLTAEQAALAKQYMALTESAKEVLMAKSLVDETIALDESANKNKVVSAVADMLIHEGATWAPDPKHPTIIISSGKPGGACLEIRWLGMPFILNAEVTDARLTHFVHATTRNIGMYKKEQAMRNAAQERLDRILPF
jgi:hypothetical protein